MAACLANTLSLVGGGIGLVARATGNDLDMTAAIPGLGDWRCTLTSGGAALADYSRALPRDGRHSAD